MCGHVRTWRTLLWLCMACAGAAALAVVLLWDVVDSSFVVPAARGTSAAGGPRPAPRPRTLVIIQGGYRTLDSTVDSIIQHVLLPNEPCVVALSLAAHTAITPATLRRLQRFPMLPPVFGRSDPAHFLGVYEYAQTLRVLNNNRSLAGIDYVIRVRADNLFVKPFHVAGVFGDGDRFRAMWRAFVAALGRRHAGAVLAAWFVTAGQPFFISKSVTRARAPNMYACPVNVHEFNRHFLHTLNTTYAPLLRDVDDVVSAQAVVQRISRDSRILYLAGGLNVHFGRTEHMVDVTQKMFDGVKPGVARLSWEKLFNIKRKGKL